VHRELHPRNRNPGPCPRHAPAGGKPRRDVCEDRDRELLGCVRGGETGARGVCQRDGGGGVGGCGYVLFFCYLWGGLGEGGVWAWALEWRRGGAGLVRRKGGGGKGEEGRFGDGKG